MHSFGISPFRLFSSTYIYLTIPIPWRFGFHPQPPPKPHWFPNALHENGMNRGRILATRSLLQVTALTLGSLTLLIINWTTAPNVCCLLSDVGSVFTDA